jgi:dihydrofolate reductase
MFVTNGVGSAVERARAVAGGKNVAIAGGGALVRQVIALGLLDQLELHVALVLLCYGLRLFEPADLTLATGEGIELTPVRVVNTPEMTHVRYEVMGRSRLVLDDRGRSDRPTEK